MTAAMVDRAARAIWIASTSDGWDDGSGVEKRMHLESGLLRSVEDFHEQALAVLSEIPIDRIIFILENRPIGGENWNKDADALLTELKK